MSVGCSSLHIPLLGHLLEREHQDSDADEGDAEGHAASFAMSFLIRDATSSSASFRPQL